MKVRLPGLVLLMIATMYALQVAQIPVPAAAVGEVMTPRTMPKILAGLLAGIGLVLLIRPGSTGLSGSGTLRTDVVLWIRAAGLMLLALVFALVLDFLGVLIASALVLFAGLFFLNVRRPLVLIAVPLGVVLVLWVLLSAVLGIYLHPGDVWLRDV
jgi:putative tricarboxylic transport membrane protein